MNYIKIFLSLTIVSVYTLSMSMELDVPQVKKQHWLSNKEKRQYKAFRDAILKIDPEFEQQFNKKYHRITRNSIQALIKFPGVIYACIDPFQKGDVILQNREERYRVTGQLALLVEEFLVGRGSAIEYFKAFNIVKKATQYGEIL